MNDHSTPQADSSALLDTLSGLLVSILTHTGLDLQFTLTRPPRPAVDPVCVEFRGRDTPMLLARNAELLHALEHIAAQALGLAPEQHDLLRFDAGGYQAARQRRLELAVRNALDHVRAQGEPFHFPPMSSRERRLLHLMLASSGLHTASEGEPPLRHLVLHPA